MERVTVVRRRKANPSVVTSPVIKPLPPNVTKNSSIDSDDVCKIHADNGHAFIVVKLDYLPEVRIPAGEKDVLIPIRTPDLGMLQFFFKGKNLP